jgi:hypothetical protein
MYIITILFNDETIHQITTCFEQESFHHLLFSFETSAFVKEFRVTDNHGQVNQNVFGFGKMNKWVQKFTYRRQNGF